MRLVFVGIFFVSWNPLVIANVVYSLNNQPTEQEGGTLTGNVTVTDTAADDGILVESEIVSWQWEAASSSGAIVISANSFDPNVLPIIVNGVSISPTAITLEPVVGPQRAFGLQHDPPGPNLSLQLVYQRDIIFGVQPFRWHSAQDNFLDASGADNLVAWSTAENDAFVNDPWIIATVIPEPSSLLLGAMASIGMLLRQRTRFWNDA